MSFLFNSYVKLLQKHTLITQMITGGICSSTGDIIYQQGLEKRGLKNHEWYRTRRLMIWGSLVFAPCANRWHAMLNCIHVGGKWTTVAARTTTDAFIFAPFATCLFYSYQGVMESRPWRTTIKMQGINERLTERLWGTVQKQWQLFVPVTLINLSIMPVYARPPFMSLASVAWSVFLSSAQNKGGIVPPKEELSNELGNEPLSVVAIEVMS